MDMFGKNPASYPHWNPPENFAKNQYDQRQEDIIEPPQPIERPQPRRDSRGSQGGQLRRPPSWLEEARNVNTRSTLLASSLWHETPTRDSQNPQIHHRPSLNVPQQDPMPYSRASDPYLSSSLGFQSSELAKGLPWDSTTIPARASDTRVLSDSRLVQPSHPLTRHSSSTQARPNWLGTPLEVYPEEAVEEADLGWNLTSAASNQDIYRPSYVPESAYADSLNDEGRRGSRASSLPLEYPRTTVDSWPASNPNLMFAVVEFKIWRSEVYTFRRSAFDPDPGLAVIVEADRGEDLGIVVGTFTNRQAAETHKIRKLRQNYATLIGYSKRPLPEPRELEMAFRDYYKFNSTSPQATGDPKRGLQKNILRPANQSEIALLRNKEGLEERAKRTCAQKIREFKYPMEVVDAELQIDHKKLTYYTLSDEYVNFSPMVTELFKIFKFRIWISVLNPNTQQTAPKVYGNVSQPTPFGSIGTRPTAGGAEMYSRRGSDLGLNAMPEFMPHETVLTSPRAPVPYFQTGSGHSVPTTVSADLDRYTATLMGEYQAPIAPWNERSTSLLKEAEAKMRSPGTPHSAISSASTRVSSRRSADYDDLLTNSFNSLNLNR